MVDWNMLNDKFEEILSGYLPSLLGAVAILILGWILALYVSGLFRSLVRRLGVDKGIAKFLDGDDKKNREQIFRWFGRCIFFILFLFVLVAFFQRLGMSSVNEPISSFLTTLFSYAPRLIAPVVLLITAWFSANSVRFILKKASQKLAWDKKMESSIGEPGTNFSEAIGEVAHWLIYLLFLPAVLESLALKGLIEPVNFMVEGFLGFLPNIFGAIAIFITGWVVAKATQKIVTNLLQSIGVDQYSQKVGVASIIGKQKVSNSIGTVIYVVILIPVLIASLNALQLDAITQPASEMLGKMLGVLPSIFSSGLVLIVSFIIGRLVADLTQTFLKSIGFDNLFEKMGFSNLVKKGKAPSEIIGHVTLVGIILFASIASLEILGFAALGDIVATLTTFLGNVLLGLFILFVGIYLSNVVTKGILSTSIDHAKILASVSKVAIIILASAMALGQLGIADEIVNMAFGLTLGSIAIAFGLAFGLGAKDTAGQLTKDFVEMFKKSLK